MFFTAPTVIEARTFTRIPKELELDDRPSAWAERMARRKLGSFLEGPSFDRDGNLWLVDIAHGRIFRVDASGGWDVVAQYDGQPNGLEIHRDGRVFVADFARGIMELDPVSGRITPFLDRERFPDFKGFNDLFMDPIRLRDHLTLTESWNFHGTAHEALGVCSGSATARFGGESGIEDTVEAGDVVIIPPASATRRS